MAYKRLVLAFLCCAGSLQADAQNDRFAEIANQGTGTRQNLLIYPQPPVLPQVFLPVTNNTKAKFSPAFKVDNAEKLKQELVKRRAQYQEFLKNYAPKLTSNRVKQIIEDFNWRVETSEDRTNFNGVLTGAGKWEKVKVPHYGPPLGKAVTFYRTTVDIKPEMLSKGALFLHFNGVDYKSKVFVNKYMVGGNEGSFIPFEFNIIRNVKAGINEILVQVENDYPMQGHVGDDGKKFDGDKVYAATGMGYDDPALGWHHNPPGMGINQTVYIEARENVHVQDVFVRPLKSLDSAEVWLTVNNVSGGYRKIKVNHSVYGQNFKATVYEKAVYEPVTIQIPGVGDLPKSSDLARRFLEMGLGLNYLKFKIAIPKARKWDTKQPWLYQIQLQLDENGKISDGISQQFGMRTFRMDTVSIPKGMMYLNDQPIRLRGANTMGNFMLAVKRGNYDQLIDDILLAKIVNLNYLRMTQMPVQDEVYEYCDRLGILTQTDLPLFGVLRRNMWAESIRQTYEMEKLVRRHPCNVVVTYINERFPNAEGNPQRHFSTYEDFRKFFLAADQAVLTANPDRVIKAGDGDYDPPSPGLPDNHNYNMWYNGHGLSIGKMMNGYWLPVKPDWYYACGEFGAEALDPLNTMLKYYPKEWLPKNINDNWVPDKISQSQTFKFHYMWVNPQKNIKDWIRVSQEHQVLATRLTSEAFRRDNRMVSFAIHLFIDAWPSGWMKTIMDVDRQPKPAYFAFKEALTPLSVQIKTDQYRVFSGKTIPTELWVCNDENSFPKGSIIKYQAEMNGKVIWANAIPANGIANGSKFQGYINLKMPDVNQRTYVTVRAAIFDNKGKSLHETDVDIEVLPKAEAISASVFVPANNTLAKSVLEELNLTTQSDIGNAKTILISDVQHYIDNKKQLDTEVEHGKQIIFLNLPFGKTKIGADSINVIRPSMGSYYFVSNATAHPIAKAFQENDFKYWYDAKQKMIAPVTNSIFYAKDWNSILQSGNTGWTLSSSYASVVAEKQFGKGMFKVCQLDLLNKMQDNPGAYRIVEKLLK